MSLRNQSLGDHDVLRTWTASMWSWAGTG